MCTIVFYIVTVTVIISILGVESGSSGRLQISGSSLTKVNDTLYSYKYDDKSKPNFTCSYKPDKKVVTKMSWEWQDKYGKLKDVHLPTATDSDLSFQEALEMDNDQEILICNADVVEIVDTGDFGLNEGDRDYQYIAIKFSTKLQVIPITPNTYLTTSETSLTTAETSLTTSKQKTPDLGFEKIYIVCGICIPLVVTILAWIIYAASKKFKTVKQNTHSSLHENEDRTHNKTNRTHLATTETVKPEVPELYSEVIDPMKKLAQITNNIYGDPYIEGLPEYASVIPKSQRKKPSPKDHSYNYINPSTSYSSRKQYANVTSDKSKYVNIESPYSNSDYSRAYEDVKRKIQDDPGYYEVGML